MALNIDTQLLGLSESDQAEVTKFQHYLRDAEHMSMDEIWDKYGEDYLGSRPIKSKGRTFDEAK